MFLWQSHPKCFIETTSRTFAFLYYALDFGDQIAYQKKRWELEKYCFVGVINTLDMKETEYL